MHHIARSEFSSPSDDDVLRVGIWRSHRAFAFDEKNKNVRRRNNFKRRRSVKFGWYFDAGRAHRFRLAQRNLLRDGIPIAGLEAGKILNLNGAENLNEYERSLQIGRMPPALQRYY